MEGPSRSAQLSLDQWIANEAIPFSMDSSVDFNAAVDRVIALIGDSVELLGFGEALHGGQDILVLRNRLFQRLVEAHGFGAIAIESSFSRGRLVNEFVAGNGPASYDDVQEMGFSHGFGALGANRELIEWMRQYNADQSHPVKVQFYGFDSPTEVMYSDSPRQVLNFVLDYLTGINSVSGQAFHERIEPLLGQDCDWETQEAAMDPSKSIGLSPAANALRLATEDLILELQMRRPELVEKTGKGRYLEAMHYALVARQLLDYHAEVARESSDRVVRLLGVRDAMMADNLAYIVERERVRGKVLAFAHNSHLKRNRAEWQAEWQPGAGPFIWWPAGAHLSEMLGEHYAVIGSAVGVSEENGISKPETGTLEDRLTSVPRPALFIPTHRGCGLSGTEIAALPVRSGSAKNGSYFPLTLESFTDYDWLAVLDSTTYSGGLWL